MERREKTTLEKVDDVFALGFTSVFWLFAVYVCGMVLSMSIRGKLRGGLFVNAVWTIYILVWLSGVTAYIISIWQSRKVTDKIHFLKLVRMPRPSDPAQASVWRWLKAASWAFWFVLAFLMSMWIAGSLGRI